MATITADAFRQLTEDVHCHDEWINGNGKPGAKTRIAGLEDAVGRIEKKLDRVGTAMWALFATVTGGILIWLLTKILPAIVANTGVG